MKRESNETSGTIKFSFDGLEPIIFTVAKASPSNEQRAMYHGWMARIGDCAALSRKQKDGSVRNITEADRRAEVERAVAHYESGSGEWELGRTTQIDPRAQKLAEAKGISIGEAGAILARIEMEALEAAMAQE